MVIVYLMINNSVKLHKAVTLRFIHCVNWNIAIIAIGTVTFNIIFSANNILCFSIIATVSFSIVVNVAVSNSNVQFDFYFSGIQIQLIVINIYRKLWKQLSCKRKSQNTINGNEEKKSSVNNLLEYKHVDNAKMTLGPHSWDRCEWHSTWCTVSHVPPNPYWVHVYIANRSVWSFRPRGPRRAPVWSCLIWNFQPPSSTPSPPFPEHW